MDENSAELRIEGEVTADRDLMAWFLGLENAAAPRIVRQIRSCAGKNLTVWLNSPGGSVVGGSAIYTALRQHVGGVTVKVDGMAASAAATISAAGDTVLMSPTAMMMIHNPATSAEGDVTVMRRAVDMLEQCKNSIVNAYVSKTGLTAREVSDLMDAETWMSADKAIELGFANGKLFEDDADDPQADPVIAAMKNAAKFCVSNLDTDMELVNALLNAQSDDRNAAKKQQNDIENAAMMQRKIALERARFGGNV